MKLLRDIFENKEEFKDFVLSDKITELVEEFLEKEETMILINESKEIQLMSGEEFDFLLSKKDISLNGLSELCCIGDDVCMEDHIKNINYKYNKY